MTSTQQRAELQRQIWQIANEVRGSVDGWDFKQYVLGTLFYRFISENFAFKEKTNHRRNSFRFQCRQRRFFEQTILSYFQIRKYIFEAFYQTSRWCVPSFNLAKINLKTH